MQKLYVIVVRDNGTIYLRIFFILTASTGSIAYTSGEFKKDSEILPLSLTTITYNSCTNDVINELSLLMLHNFVICGHISYQQESSQRAILDLSSTSLDCGRGWY